MWSVVGVQCIEARNAANQSIVNNTVANNPCQKNKKTQKQQQQQKTALSSFKYQ
jgi:hypothetical protein